MSTIEKRIKILTDHSLTRSGAIDIATYFIAIANYQQLKNCIKDLGIEK